MNPTSSIKALHYEAPMMTTFLSLDSQQLAHVLAGLRLLQAQTHADAVPAPIHDILSDEGTHAPLGPKAIDDLCQHIIQGGPQPLVIAKVSGGALRGTVSNVPGINVLVLDYDVEGVDRKLPKYPEFRAQPDARDEAYARYESPLVAAGYTDLLRTLADADIAVSNAAASTTNPA